MPFPHVERAVTVRRPALVVARRDTDAVGTLFWTVMVTSAERAPWAGDIPIPATAESGLRIPSKVRTAKITTIGEGGATTIGRLDGPTWRAVLAAVRIGDDPEAPHVQ